MATQTKETEVKNAVNRAIEGTGDTVNGTIDVTKSATVSAVRSVGKVGEAIAKTVSGAVATTIGGVKVIVRAPFKN